MDGEAILPHDIGAYRVLTRIGEGGMGVVYLAEQRKPITRRVAIKLIRSGVDSREIVARFHAERQALAMMNHPNIAQIFDAGVHEGRPYFVMEHIAGLPITEYADRVRLSIDDRLRLLLDVCLGVQHAHQKGVIHRDLKPTNVLVTEHDGIRAPKIIDFGIAKAVSGRLFEATVHTEMGRIIGTPDYMSPEQADLTPEDVDTRTDVYSLGALLYELLSGTTIFGLAESKANHAEIQRVIAEREPARPSSRFTQAGETAVARATSRRSSPEQLVRRFRRDLDWITLKALEKDRSRRYASVSEFMSDLHRYLTGEPVVARPPSGRYRLGKFVKRNRAAVAVAGAIAGVLVVSSAVSVSFAMREARQREEAERATAALRDEKRISEELREEAITARDRAIAMTSFLTGDLLAAARPSTRAGRGRDVTMREVLDVASERIDHHTEPGGIFANRPEVECQLRAALGATYFDLSLYDEAERHLARSSALAAEHLPPDDQTRLELSTRMGTLYQRLGRFEESERAYHEAVDLYTQAFGREHPEVLRPLGNLGLHYKAQGDYLKAEPIYREVLERRMEILGPEHEETIIAGSNLAVLLMDMQRYEDARPISERAVADARRSLGPRHVSTLNAIRNHGALLEDLGQLEEAEALLRESVEGAREIFGSNHEQTAINLNNLGTVLRKVGKLDEASEVMLEALAINRAILGERNPNTIIAISNVAGVMRDADDFSGAAELSAQALTLADEVFPPTHWIPGALRVRHAESLLGLEQFEEARDLALEGYDRIIEALGEDNARVRNAASVLASIHVAWDEASPSAELAEAALLWKERAGEEP